MYFLSGIVLALGVFALVPRFVLDAGGQGKYAEGFGGRGGALPGFDGGGRPVGGPHCVSVGEAQAARPLARAILEEYPRHALVVSTTTRTGQRVAREAFGDAAALVFYFPFDWAWSVRRALRAINPSAALVMETELWPRFFRECRRRGVLEASTPLPATTQAITPRTVRPRLLVAPRHPERFGEVAALVESSGLSWARRSDAARERDAACEVILLDSIGELRAVYPLAEVVFVGGSIAPVGGHNVLEPALAARSVVTGPHPSNFKAVLAALLEQGAPGQLPHAAGARAAHALARVLRELLEDDAGRRRMGERARAVLEQDRGATARTVKLLAPLLRQRSEVGGQRSVKNLLPADLQPPPSNDY